MIPLAHGHTRQFLREAVQSWAEATSSAASPRYADLLRDKSAALLGDGRGGGHGAAKAKGFFALIDKAPLHITPDDIHAWQSHMEQAQLSSATIYARISRLSSFYTWLMQDPAWQKALHHNPVAQQRPKAPPPYSAAVNDSLSDQAVQALLAVIKADAAQDDVAALRDDAMLRFYLVTGKRRREIVALQWGDLQIDGAHVRFVNGQDGHFEDREVVGALMRYLRASGRWDAQHNTPKLSDTAALWLRHDRAAQRPTAVTSHGFVKALKGYAKRAHIGHIHLHQTRHTVARVVSEQAGNLADVQAVLGHQNIATTRAYLARIKQDAQATLAPLAQHDGDEAD
jgi:integrase/recombinase XerD